MKLEVKNANLNLLQLWTQAIVLDVRFAFLFVLLTVSRSIIFLTVILQLILLEYDTMSALDVLYVIHVCLRVDGDGRVATDLAHM